MLQRLAAEAEGMEIGTNIVLLPLQNPMEMAEVGAFLDVLHAKRQPSLTHQAACLLIGLDLSGVAGASGGRSTRTCHNFAGRGNMPRPLPVHLGPAQNPVSEPRCAARPVTARLTVSTPGGSTACPEGMA